MKTTLIITLFLITSISFAQVKEKNELKKQVAFKTKTIKKKERKAFGYIKFDDVKGEVTSTSIKRVIINPIRKNPNLKRWWVNKKMKESSLTTTTSKKRRRVEVLKSNKQGDPNKN
ncbi:hypothetical protein [uncultured Lutibacter sp.]|uniref:hypothetical protein n=1 Tax=uncultured Lutibacter sp. TaxID=437739 RepID=UPI002616BFAD|nr:hypothetical protein [uncultured Lutibacter sp.]